MVNHSQTIVLERVIKNIMLISMMSLSFIVKGDNDTLEWLSKSYDFGIMREIAGPATGSVKFVNKGTNTTIINKVRPSCGCTGAEFTEGLIAPGDTATVWFTYNPAGRPGRFEKTVKVYTGSNNDLTTIRISGTVVGAPESLERDYPYEVGGLRVAEKRVNLGKIRYGTSRHRFIRLYNQTSEPLELSVISDDKALKAESATEQIAPGDVGTLSLYLDTRSASGPGNYSTKVHVRTDKESESEIIIDYAAEIEEDLTLLTPEEIEKGPICETTPGNVVDLGLIRKKENKNLKEICFKISNKGRTPLVINRIFDKSGKIVVKTMPTVIASGKEYKVKCSLDIGRIASGAFRIPIEIQSNDVLHPVIRLNVVGIIKD